MKELLSLTTKKVTIDFGFMNMKTEIPRRSTLEAVKKMTVKFPGMEEEKVIVLELHHDFKQDK